MNNKENISNDNTVTTEQYNNHKRLRDSTDDTVIQTSKYARTVDSPIDSITQSHELIDLLNGNYQWHKSALQFVDMLQPEQLHAYIKLLYDISHELNILQSNNAAVTGKRLRKSMISSQSMNSISMPSTDNTVIVINDMAFALPRGRYSVTCTLTHILLQPKTSVGTPLYYQFSDINQITVLQSRDTHIVVAMKHGESIIMKYNTAAKQKSTDYTISQHSNTDVARHQSTLSGIINNTTLLQHKTILSILQQLTNINTIEQHDRSVFNSTASNKLHPGGVTCYIKTRDGILHLYKSGLYFISTVCIAMPVQWIQHVAIQSATSTTVNINVVMNDNTQYEFIQVNKNESIQLNEYITMINQLIAKRAIVTNESKNNDSTVDSDADSDGSDSDFSESGDDSSSDISEEYDSDIENQSLPSSDQSIQPNSDSSSDGDNDENDMVHETDSDDVIDIDRFVAG